MHSTRPELSYFAVVESSALGVRNKIEGTLKAAEKLGLNAKRKIFEPNKKGVINFLKSLCLSRSNIAFIRYSDLLAPALFLCMLTLRFRGVTVVLDIPTPRKSLSSELDSQDRNLLNKLARKFMNFLGGSWIVSPATVILQYADEGLWYSFGVRSKTMLIGNGIFIDHNIPLSNTQSVGTCVKLVGVARVSYWHGYDRVLYALSEIENKNIPHQFSFSIVGDGDEIINLKSLAKRLNLTNIKFHGLKRGNELDAILDDCHIGISSLGLYRKGIDTASSLKTREYLARGLMVIDSGKDPDFEQTDFPFRIQVSNDSSIASLVGVLSNLKLTKLPAPARVRTLASPLISFEPKLRAILARAGCKY